MNILDVYANLLFESSAETLREAVEEAVKAGADLFGAILRGADLSGANLSGANLYGANLYGADLSGARVSRNAVWPNGFDHAAAGIVTL